MAQALLTQMSGAETEQDATYSYENDYAKFIHVATEHLHNTSGTFQLP